MSRRVLVAAAAVIVAAGATALAVRPNEVTASVRPPAPPVPSEAEIRDLDIAFWQKRAIEDPIGASDRSRLAILYLRRARETGSFADYERAERVSRESIALRTAHNDGTLVILASALLAQHKFTEALTVARELNALSPEILSNRAMLAEIDLETGRYTESDSLFTALKHEVNQPSLTARLARWHELSGRIDLAQRLLERTVRFSEETTNDFTREQKAWFYYRLGEIRMKRGQLAGADSALTRGLAIYSEDYRILGALARLELARGQWQAAVDYGSRAIAIQLDPATLGAMSDAYKAMGDSAQASQYANAMRVSALKQPGPIHRAWGLFLLDRREDVDRVLARARKELDSRKDIYGYDLVAWALHAKGRDTEAREMMRHALSRGTEDAMLFYHAGEIARAVGDSVEATADLAKAREINPTYRPLQDSARTVASRGN